MRVWLLVYGALYVVVELIGQSLATVGWARITALDVATAATDAFLTVSVVLAVLLALKLGAERWGRTLRSAAPPAQVLPAGPLGVRSWRAEPPALPVAGPPAPPSAPSRGTYEVGAHGFASRRRGRRLAPSFPEEPGTLL